MRRVFERAFGSLGRRIALLLGVLAVLSFAPWAVSRSARTHLDGAARQLDAVGSLRYRLLALALAHARGAPDAELARIDAGQRATLARVIEGQQGLPGCARAGACARLEAHRTRWSGAIVPGARGQAPTEAFDALVADELRALDATVGAMAEATQRDVDALERQGALATGGGVLLLVLAGLLVGDVFSRIRRVRDAAEAEDPGAQLGPLAQGPDEVAAVARAVARSLEALREAEEAERTRVAQLLEAVPDAVVVVGASGVIEYANAHVEGLFGWAPEELVGEPIEALVPEAARARHAGVRAEYAADPHMRPMGQALDIRGRRKDGTTFYADVELSPVTIEGRRVVVASARDVTERRESRRRLEELGATLERANAELEARNAELEQFAFAASHDMQEPLRKIIAFGGRIEQLHGAALDERGRDYLARMQSAARRMQLLINDLLRWSRLTTRAEPFTPVDLDAIAKEVLDDLEVAIEKAGATVDIGPLTTLDADAPQMRQLLQNLIGNAIKYRDEARAPVIEVRGEPAGAGRYRLVVRDNGIGFEQKYADRIFDVFERLHGRTEYEGTGIGLALCKKIVRRHGGEITVTSAPGVGTTFVTTLPLTQPESAA
ncbi:MAG: PAS domain S-box protein [Sandaracinaceae bacterium]|nr:PAS domain S-box protein [Sandaracinaceae bacterium]